MRIIEINLTMGTMEFTINNNLYKLQPIDTRVELKTDDINDCTRFLSILHSNFPITRDAVRVIDNVLIITNSDMLHFFNYYHGVFVDKPYSNITLVDRSLTLGHDLYMYLYEHAITRYGDVSFAMPTTDFVELSIKYYGKQAKDKILATDETLIRHDLPKITQYAYVEFIDGREIDGNVLFSFCRYEDYTKMPWDKCTIAYTEEGIIKCLEVRRCELRVHGNKPKEMLLGKRMLKSRLEKNAEELWTKTIIPHL